MLAVLLVGAQEDLAKASFRSPDGEIEDSVRLEVADTPQERQRGLMFRTELRGDGMLFVFEEELNRSFWMKNTLIPLDMVFVGSDGRINRIHTAYPQPEASNGELERYTGSAKYVVELRANHTIRNSIEEGDVFKLENK